jgi:hypothetical protein
LTPSGPYQRNAGLQKLVPGDARRIATRAIGHLGDREWEVAKLIKVLPLEELRSPQIFWQHHPFLDLDTHISTAPIGNNLDSEESDIVRKVTPKNRV